MSWIADRDTVAVHAAARALLLLDTFNRVAELTEINVQIKPFEGDEPGYTVTTTVSWPNGRPQNWYWIEKNRGRDEIIREVAQYVINDAAEDVTTGLSAEARTEAMEMARDRACHFVNKSMAFVEGVSEEELEDMAQEAFDLAINLLKDKKDEFDNLTQVFRRRDHLESRKTIEVAAWTGLAPAMP